MNGCQDENKLLNSGKCIVCSYCFSEFLIYIPCISICVYLCVHVHVRLCVCISVCDCMCVCVCPPFPPPPPPDRWRKWLWPCRTLTWAWRWETRGSSSLSFHTPWQVCVCLFMSVCISICVCMCGHAHCRLCLSRWSCIMQQWILVEYRVLYRVEGGSRGRKFVIIFLSPFPLSLSLSAGRDIIDWLIQKHNICEEGK